MRHFNFLFESDRQRLFFHQPENFDISSDKKLLATSLGATLYCPATRPNLVEDVLKLAHKGVASVVICLEDAIPDEKVPEAEANLVVTLKALLRLPAGSLPLLFVRVRNPIHLAHVAEMNRDSLSVLTGFVLPKFEDMTGTATEYVKAMRDINTVRINRGQRELFFMPVLESPLMIFSETRKEVLSGIKTILDANKDIVLAVRIGATDMSSPYAIRRSRDLTIYDVHLIASVISEVVNLFGRADGGFVVTGAVWEHFTDRERLFKPGLRSSPFEGVDETKLRRDLLVKDLDGLIREIELDRANGILGKTVIHPTHVSLVHAMNVVTHEEYSDALSITGEDKAGGGASASSYRNKMNEVKPHMAWAEKTLLRAKVFGVANSDVTFVDFLEASMKL